MGVFTAFLRALFTLQVYVGLYLRDLRTITLYCFDLLMDTLYPYVWTLDSRTSHYEYKPKHIMITGGINPSDQKKRRRYICILARIMASSADCGIRLLTLYYTQARWHYEDANDLVLEVTSALRELGFIPFVSFVHTTFDESCFLDQRHDPWGVRNPLDDAEFEATINVVILSPIAARADLSSADLVIQLLDKRHVQESFLANLRKDVSQKPLTMASMLDHCAGTKPDTSGKFSGLPDLTLGFSRRLRNTVEGISPWLLQIATIYYMGSLGRFRLNSFARALLHFNTDRIRRFDRTKKLA